MGLVSPRPGVFQEHIRYLLCLTMPYEIVILGVSFTGNCGGQPLPSLSTPDLCLCLSLSISFFLCLSLSLSLSLSLFASYKVLSELVKCVHVCDSTKSLIEQHFISRIPMRFGVLHANIVTFHHAKS